MQEIKARLQEKIKRTASVESFRLLPFKKIDFLPGQFLQVIFDEADKSNKGLNKYLSFSSSPANAYIEFTKRLSESNFSQKLRDLKPEDEVLLKAPLGACVFKEEYKRIAFLIGGIGITPVISIVEYIIGNNLATDVLLIYSNRLEEEIAFKKELDYWQALNNKIKVRYIITEHQPKDKSCIFGRIDKELLLREALDLKERIVFIFGPPKMVEAMSTLSLELRCSKENIKTENFIGY
jgi:ferredoxin-NADP reductase